MKQEAHEPETHIVHEDGGDDFAHVPLGTQETWNGSPYPPAYEGEDQVGPNPQLVIGDVTVVRGAQSRRALEAAVRATLSHW